ncbi:hypothetical protein SDC9_57607 [bioreactor metagenome]|uniref:Uncharacterized protein n=1 Tax=bioreactor metagenome TaxID=1076179 RepID=A0A644X5N3_9ZZZZ
MKSPLVWTRPSPPRGPGQVRPREPGQVLEGPGQVRPDPADFARNNARSADEWEEEPRKAGTPGKRRQRQARSRNTGQAAGTPSKKQERRTAPGPREASLGPGAVRRGPCGNRTHKPLSTGGCRPGQIGVIPCI